MIFSPIFHVELLTVGRRRRYFVARVAYALVLLVVMGFCYLGAFSGYRTSTLNDQAEFSYAFFAAFSWVQLIVVLGLTPAMIAGTISVEHERKTIDYLLTTQLSDTEIALGKFAARVWSVIMQLLVGVPILAIALMLGGVGPGQMLASFGVSLVTLIFTATLSLALSARAARSRESITRSYLVIIALMIAPPFLLLIAEGLAGAGPDWPLVTAIGRFLKDPLDWLVGIHPFVKLTELLGGHMGMMNISDFGTFAATYLGASALLAVSAVVGVRRFYLKIAGRSSGRDGGSWFGRIYERLGGRRRPVGDRAMIWKETTSLRSAINLGWAGRIAAALLFGLMIFYIGFGLYWTLTENSWRQYSRNSPMEMTAMVEVPMIFGLIILLITSNAAGSITGERERDTWITLMSTPVDGEEIVRAKLFAVFYGVRYWYAMIVVCWALAAYFNPAMLFIAPLSMALHFMCAMFAACVGLRCSLQASTSLKSMGTALAIIVFALAIVPVMGSGFLGLASREGEISMFFMPASLPVLFSAPHPIIMAAMHETNIHSELGAFIAGCMVWAVVYAFATGLIYQQLTTAFDEYAGRTRPRGSGGGDRSPRPVVERSSVPKKTAPLVLDELELVDEAEPHP